MGNSVIIIKCYRTKKVIIFFYTIEYTNKKSESVLALFLVRFCVSSEFSDYFHYDTVLTGVVFRLNHFIYVVILKCIENKKIILSPKNKIRALLRTRRAVTR